ncbi:MAG: ATP synthase F1 subunit delta [bacterium]
MATVSTKNLAQAIYESSLGKSGRELDAVVENSVRMIASRNMIGKSTDILTQLQLIMDKDTKTVRATITSSHFLSKKNTDIIEKELKKRYTAEQVELTMKEDEKLINGLRIEVGDEIIDLSLAHQIGQLQDYLLKN